MSCACGHHHPAPADVSGRPVPLARPLVALHGRLICTDMSQMLTALDLLPDHRALSRAEPGCLRFDVEQSEDPMVWTLTELFADDAAFAAHQTRTTASPWGQASRALTRDFHRHEVQPLIRSEAPGDHEALDRLLTLAFGRPDEARLLRRLRADGDLAVSLLAHAEGVPIAHVALSPLQADRPALALTPIAVHPALQRRGLGRALTAAALAAAGDRPVVALGDPGLYAGCGFLPADLASPWSGPALQIHGALPPGSRITHAPAFHEL
ncbi:GNAT family N-acetyltransferase [Paracoccus gahaiensis]|uniref:GNAT family N-acetyltransferase n=1 Tax=Paracoccus gahaiensis TaxID=1706839 RepID=A0A4U0RHB4_9RHOB|nr:GNAT family N-acetyltransferase [Paracoccus gahaiensis]TJZ94100.1 GNAT family N-acetyltransferase [Paracoccus gahaiensis]